MRGFKVKILAEKFQISVNVGGTVEKWVKTTHQASTFVTTAPLTELSSDF